MIGDAEAATFASARGSVDQANSIYDITHAAIATTRAVALFKFRNEFV